MTTKDKIITIVESMISEIDVKSNPNYNSLVTGTMANLCRVYDTMDRHYKSKYTPKKYKKSDKDED